MGADYNDRWVSFVWLVPVVLVSVLVGSLTLKDRGNALASYPVAVTSAHIATLFEKTEDMPVGERIAFWSEQLLKEPGLLAPLGRGPEVTDTAPVFPPSYDCTTFVETVAGLARSESAAKLADRIIAIRYRDGKVSFGTRNHFPEADWIPNNVAAGILTDITPRLARDGGFLAAYAHKEIDKQAWFKAQGAAGRSVASTAASSVEVELPYLPIAQALDSVKFIPQGAVINVVRESDDSHPTLVSHQGLLVWRNGIPFFRHAGRDHPPTEVPFAEYVRTLKHDRGWRVLGFNVNTFSG